MHLFETEVRTRFKVIYEEKLCHLWSSPTVRVVNSERVRSLMKKMFREFKVLFNADLSVQ